MSLSPSIFPGDRLRTGFKGQNPLWLLGAVVPVLVVLLLAAGLGPVALGVAAAVAALIASILNVRIALLIGISAASFVNYGAGHLTRDFSLISAWFLFVGLILLWRSAWVGWKMPSPGVRGGILVWLAACFMGVTVGLVNGNNPHFLFLELLAAAWPVLGLLVLQVFDSRTLRQAALGLLVLALAHTVFGLANLQAVGQRLGGVYFMSIPGLVAVGLWGVALLADRLSIRLIALASIVPLICHLFFSFTRGYWLAYIAAMFVMTFLAKKSLNSFRPRNTRRFSAMIAGFAGALVLAVLVVVLYSGGHYVLDAAGQRFQSSLSTEASGETASNVFRLVEYSEAIRLSLKSPIIGTGFGSTLVMVDPFFGYRTTQWFVHNYYLLIWLKLGIVGLLAVGFLLYRLIRRALHIAFENPRWEVRCWALAAIAVTIQGLVISLTNFTLAEVNTAFFLAFVWGVLWALDRESREHGDRAQSPRTNPPTPSRL